MLLNFLKIQGILPNVPTEDIICLLQKHHGDEEKVTLLLLESAGEQGTTRKDFNAHWTGSIDSDDIMIDSEDLDEIEESDEVDDRDMMRSSVGINDAICEEDLAGWGKRLILHWIKTSDPSNFGEDFYEHDEWADSDEAEEGELKNWFISPEQEINQELVRSEAPDMFTKLYQEIADEEYARELVWSSRVTRLTLQERGFKQGQREKKFVKDGEGDGTFGGFFQKDYSNIPYCPPQAYNSTVSTYVPGSSKFKIVTVEKAKKEKKIDSNT